MRKRDPVEIRFARIPNAIGAIVFGAPTCIVAEALFIGKWDVGGLSTGDWVAWVLFVAFAIGTLVCLKTALFPSLMFAWDTSGVKIGRGVFVNRIITVAWAHVLDIKETKMQITVKRNNRSVEKWVPALSVVVDESIDLGTRGFNYACPATRHDYRIAEKRFRRPLAEVVQTLKEMKTRHEKH